MANAYVNKVVKSDGTTLIDLTSDTVTSAEHIVSGHTGHLADGSQVTGTATVGVDVPVYTVVWDDNWESPISVSCNKGYYEIEFGNAVMVYMTNQSHTEGGYAVAVTSESGSSYYQYTVMSQFVPFMDIRHNNDNTITFTTPSSFIETLNVSQNGTYYPEHGVIQEVNVSVPATVPSLQSKSVSYTPSETAQSATVTADSGYDGLSSVEVSVGAISSSYVGSGIDRRSSSDLTASGATVTVPSGYYASQATKSVASGTEGTPTATKGSVSNHSVSVTPSVTNAAGYISGGTKTGTAITVSASELVSGSETVTENGTVDVTNLASVVVNVPSGGGISIDSIATHQILGTITITGTSVSAYAFYGNRGITGISAPNLTTIGDNAFMNALDNSGTYVFPEVTTLGANCFNGAQGNFFLPKCTTLSGQMQKVGANGKFFAMPKLTSAIGTDVMRTGYATILDLGQTPSIGLRGLYQGNGKQVIILRKTDAITTLGTSGLTIANTCRVYVPSALIDTYKNATNWSSYTKITWMALEESPYESEDWPLQ